MITIALTILLIVWMIFTLILGISIIGVIVILTEDYNRESYWFSFGKYILKNI